MADVFDAIAKHVSERPDACALLGADESLSYAQYQAAFHTAADNARAWGIGSGAFVGISAYASLDYVLLLMGLLHAGTAPCPMSARWPMRAILNALRPLNGTHLFLPSHVEIPGIEVHTLREIRSPMASERGDQRGRSRMDSNAPCLCIFTSGSTSQPKAALHGCAGLSYSAETANANMPLASGDRWLLSLQPSHVAGIGIVFRCALAGATVVLPAPAESIEDSILRCGVTHVSLVATQLHRLMGSERGVEALSRLKGILLGGSAMPPTLIRRAFSLGLPISTSYGMTETASQIAATRAGDSLQKLLTSGRPLAPDTVRIVHTGEIQVRGPALFLGYHTDGRLQRPLTDDGWFATGDHGTFDANGYLRVSGRTDRMFIAGGENIQPEAIEQQLCMIEGVGAAIVVPVPDEEFGQLPVAFVLMEPVLDVDRLRVALEEALPRFQIPRHFFPWPEQLRRVDGKVSLAGRRKLIRLAMAFMARNATPPEW